ERVPYLRAAARSGGDAAARRRRLLRRPGHRPGGHVTRVLAGRDPRAGGGAGGRARPRRPAGVVRAHAAHRRRLRRPQPSRPRLRDDVLLGHPGDGPVGRLDRRLGDHHDRRPGARVARRRRRPVRPAGPRAGRLDGVGAADDGPDRGADPAHGRRLRARHGAVRPHAERADRGADPGAGRVRRGGGDPGRPGRQPAGRADPGVELAGPVRGRWCRAAGRPAAGRLRVLGLGVGGQPHRGDDRQPARAGAGRRPLHRRPAAHLPRRRDRRAGLRRHRLAGRQRRRGGGGVRAAVVGGARRLGLGGAARRRHLGDRLDADHDHPGVAHRPVDGPPGGAAGAVRRDLAAAPHPRRLHVVGRRRRHRLVRRGRAGQRERPLRLDHRPLPADRALLRHDRHRVRGVLPPPGAVGRARLPAAGRRPAGRGGDARLAAGAVGARPRRRGELLHRAGLVRGRPTAGHRRGRHGGRGGADAVVAAPRRGLLGGAALGRTL
ncbi:MAG: Uncharacterized amino acid permease, GabP family, partial [uncultured Blastococcus sp.]